jgi:hypothetical protein
MQAGVVAPDEPLAGGDVMPGRFVAVPRMWGAALGTVVGAPSFGLILGVALTLETGDWLSLVALPVFSLIGGLLMVAIPAMVLAPAARSSRLTPTERDSGALRPPSHRLESI